MEIFTIYQYNFLFFTSIISTYSSLFNFHFIFLHNETFIVAHLLIFLSHILYPISCISKWTSMFNFFQLIFQSSEWSFIYNITVDESASREVRAERERKTENLLWLMNNAIRYTHYSILGFELVTPPCNFRDQHASVINTHVHKRNPYIKQKPYK